MSRKRVYWGSRRRGDIVGDVVGGDDELNQKFILDYCRIEGIDANSRTREK